MDGEFVGTPSGRESRRLVLIAPRPHRGGRRGGPKLLDQVAAGLDVPVGDGVVVGGDVGVRGFRSPGALAQDVRPQRAELTDVLGEVAQRPVGTRRHQCAHVAVSQRLDDRADLALDRVHVLVVLHRRTVGHPRRDRHEVCGADADRTRYLFHAMEALYQLTYSPGRVSQPTTGPLAFPSPDCPGKCTPTVCEFARATCGGRNWFRAVDSAPVRSPERWTTGTTYRRVSASGSSTGATRPRTRSTTTIPVRSSTCCPCTRTRRGRHTWVTCATTPSVTSSSGTGR